MYKRKFVSVWLDGRTAETVDTLLEKCPQGDKNHLRVRVYDVLSILNQMYDYSECHPH